MTGNPLSSAAWALDNGLRKEIPDLGALDKAALKAKANGAPGIYSLIGPGDTRAFMTINAEGQVSLWGLAYDPEYLGRAFATQKLEHKGKLQV